MSKRKPTIRRTNSADTFSNTEEYNTERNMSGLLGHHDLSVLAETPSYTTPLNDLISSNSGKKDDIPYYRNEDARLQRELNEQSSTRNRKPVKNDLNAKSHSSMYAPIPVRNKSVSSKIKLPDPRKYTQFTKHDDDDDEGLPPTSSSKKSSSLKSKKEPSEFKILRMPSRQLYSPATQTFMETRKIKPKSKSKSKSKGGKNKTKKRKAKKTKKNKKNKK
jgi:hypothetical protein